ncbi:MAG: hypothetical protein HY655_09680 [Acidobacteria bacterium]|nr:hypothetical protein [Acidobacteriota bacterium]
MKSAPTVDRLRGDAALARSRGGGIVSIKKSLRTMLACFVLQIGVLAGVPMRPEQVKELMQLMNQPKLAQTDPSESDPSDDPIGARDE